MKRARLIVVPALLGLALVGGCSRKDETAAPAASQSAAPEAKPGLALTEARLVLPAVKGNPGVAYFSVANTGEKVAVLAAVSLEGAASAEMHQSQGGTMGPVSRVEIAPGTTIRFAPGGLHVMVFGLDPKIAAPGPAEITLTFADGDKISAKVPVETAGAAAMGGMHEGHQM